MEETLQNVDKTYTDPETGKFVVGNPGGGRPKETEQENEACPNVNVPRV